MAAQLLVGVVERGSELVRPVDPAAIDAHHPLCAGLAESGHHWMEIVAQCLGIKMGDAFREAFGGAIRPSAAAREQHAAGDAAPGAVARPGLAFQGLLPFALTLPQRP
jgi:hypothetical protein